MDINMPGMNGIEATRLIMQDQPDTQIISFSMHEAPFLADAMRRAGAVAVVRKKAPVEDLLAALTRCLRRARPAAWAVS